MPSTENITEEPKVDPITTGDIPSSLNEESACLVPEVVDTQEYSELPLHKSVAYRSDLPVMTRRTLTNSSGRQVAASVYADILLSNTTESGTQQERWLLARRNAEPDDERLARHYLLKVTEQENHELLIVDSKLVTVDSVITCGEGIDQTYLSVGHGGNGSNFSLSFLLHAGQAGIAVSEDARTVRNPRTETERKERREKVKRGIQKVVGTVALLTSIAPGGMVDSVLDEYDNPEGVVRAAASSMYEEPYNNETGDKLSEEVLARVNSEREQRNEVVREAEESISQLMADLDERNYDAIIERAVAFERQNPGEIMTRKMVSDYLDQLSNTKTNQEAIEIFEKFSEFFGVEARFQTESDSGYVNAFDESTNVESTKYTINTIMSSMSLLPRSMVEGSQLHVIELGSFVNPLEPGNPLVLPVLGVTRDSRVISIPVLSSNLAKAMDYGAFLENGSGVSDRVILHEIDHTIPGAIVNPQFEDLDANEMWVEGSEATEFAAIMFKYLVSRIAGFPDSVSFYANYNPDERSAENFSSLIGNNFDILNPNNVRGFHSPAAKEMLRLALAIEMEIPGYNSWVIVQRLGK